MARAHHPGPPPPPRGAVALDRRERLSLVVAGVLLATFAAVVGHAHAEAACGDIVEVWASGESRTIGSTCDPARSSDDGETPDDDAAEVRAPDPAAVGT